MSSNLHSEFQPYSFSEYKTTKSKGIKSQIYSSNKEYSNPKENIGISDMNINNINFAKIIPMKVLSTLNEGESIKSKNNINENVLNNLNYTNEQINNFNFGNINLNSTSETAQNIENNLTEEKQNLNNFDINNLENGENIINTDLNIINDNFDLNNLKTNIETNQAFEYSNSEKKDLTQNLETNYEQEKTNLASNAYQISENNTNNESTGIALENFDLNNLTSAINANIDTNNLQAIEPVVDTTQTSNTDNLDLNALTNTNIETKTNEEITKNYNYSEFQVPNSTNNLDEIANIDINAFQNSETIIDTNKTKENFDINNLTSEINKNVDIMNNFQAETTTTDNYDLNNLMINTEITQNFETSQNFESSTYKTSEITPSVNINTLPETLEPLNNKAQTDNMVNNLDLNSLTTNIDTTKKIDAEQILDSANPSFDINALTNTESIDTNTYQNSEKFLDNKTNENFDFSTQPTVDKVELTNNNNLDINTLTTNMEKEQAFNDYKFQTSESASPFDINVINETSNLDSNLYKLNQPEKTIKNEYNDINNLVLTSDVNITSTKNLESVQITTTSENFDINALKNEDIKVKEDFDLNILTNQNNQENIQSLDMNNFNETEYTSNAQILSNNIPTPSLEINNLTSKENEISNIEFMPSFDINNLKNNTTEQISNNNNEFQTTDIISSETNINNSDQYNYDITNITPAIDSNSALQTNTEFYSKNTDYQLENNNIIDATSALQTKDLDINTFLGSNNIDIAKDSNTNIENNEFIDSTFKNNEETNPLAFENISNDMNTFATITEITPDLNMNEYQAANTIMTKSNSYDIRIKDLKISNNIIGIEPTPYATIENRFSENKIEYSHVTPLQGKIVKKIDEKIVATVTPMSNFSITTFRPFEGKNIGKKNNIFNFGKIKKNLAKPKEYSGYKSSTYNPMTSKL